LNNGPVLVAFFKVSCPTCQLTFPFLQRLADSHDDNAPRLLAVSQDDASASRGFQNRFGVSMPTVIDVPRSWPASDAYQITSVPSLFLVETDGTISLTSEGFSKAAIESLGERFHVAPFKESDRIPELRPG
jgi:peroxiredoxin